MFQSRRGKSGVSHSHLLTEQFSLSYLLQSGRGGGGARATGTGLPSLLVLEDSAWLRLRGGVRQGQGALLPAEGEKVFVAMMWSLAPPLTLRAVP